MKSRITYLIHPLHDFDPQTIRPIADDGLSIGKVRAAKEHRVTIGLPELPAELATLLEQSHELHIRWQSTRLDQSIGPYTSKITPGLHVFFTPRDDQPTDSLCPALKAWFSPNLKCKSYLEAFTHPSVLSTRFATSASSQYYSDLLSLSGLANHIQSIICTGKSKDCQRLVEEIKLVSHLDADYDAISHALTISAYWDRPSEGHEWNDEIHKIGIRDEKIEVGVFNHEAAPSNEDVKLGGWVAIVGESQKASTTLFSFPSRHHSLKGSSFTASLDTPAGLHPTLRLRINSPRPASNPSCSLHGYLTLTSPIFLDRYAFTDPLALRSHNLGSLRSISGATDLEAPDWIVSEWGSASLFELSPPEEQQANAEGLIDFEVTFPLHLRYLSPTSGGYKNASLPLPVVFWACRAQDDEAPPLSTNPFDRRNLGYDGLFSDQTLFYHVSAIDVGESGPANVSFPVLDMDEAWYVQVSTVVVVCIGTLWILWKLLGSMQIRPRSSSVHSVEVAGKKEHSKQR